MTDELVAAFVGPMELLLEHTSIGTQGALEQLLSAQR